MLLEVKNLVVSYGGAKAVRNVSLGLDQGQIVTLIGANGAGKSTILRAISGLSAPTSGEIWFDGARIDRKAVHKIASLGISHVIEGRGLFPRMSVQENLLMGCYLAKDKKWIVQTMEGVFQHFPVLRNRKKQGSGTLSGGEQQMLAIGQALMSNPKLLLLDEPSLGLSPRFAREIGNIVININRMGVSVLLAEQNARLALTLAHNAYVLETGTVKLEGATKDLINYEDVKKAYLR
ncbi:ABC transporter ATP-binding protein [Chloroflexota bacterium]